MSLSHYKRPSSARRHIKQDTFSSFASRRRLQLVQSILRDGNGDEAGTADAILCILGIDSRFSEGSRELIDYLLFGFFESRRLEVERSGFAEDTVDDMMFCVQCDNVDVYCNPINYHYLLPYIAHWPNLHLHCLQEDEYEDEEKAEEFKIKSLVAMVDGCHTIGLPYSSSGTYMEFDKMNIEKWPIIQAYAVEGVGGGGFFTLKHPVTDVTSSVQRLYHLMDTVAVETLLIEKLPLFEKQCSAMLGVLDVDRGEKVLHETEASVCEALSSYFHHGGVRSSKSLPRDTNQREPFVLFGTHSLEKHMLGSSDLSSEISIAEAGLNGQCATHMVFQAVSARSPLACARTYFFHTGFMPYSVGKDTEGWKQSRFSDIEFLQMVYFACVAAVHAAISEYTNSLSVSRAHHKAMKTLADYIVHYRLPHAEHFKQRNVINFKMEAFNNFNCCMVLEEGQYLPLVKTASITVYDVPSVNHRGAVLGSVVFADAFLESAIHVRNPDGSAVLDGDYIVLTSYIPRFVNLPVQEKKYAALLERCIKEDCCENLGNKLSSNPSVTLVINENDTEIPFMAHKDGQLHCFTEGIVYVHPHCGYIVVPRSMTREMAIYDGNSPSVVVLIMISYKYELRQHLPKHFVTPSNQLILVFGPKSKASKSLFSKVLPEWKQWTGHPVLEQLDELPSDIENLHQQFQRKHDVAQSKSMLEVSTLNRPNLMLSEIRTFLDHFAYSSVSQEPVPSRHLNAVLGQPYDEGSFGETDELIVTVLSGLPGSGKENLCQSLTRLAKEDSRWAVLQQPAGSPETFDSQQLQSSLSAIWRSQHKRKPGLSSKRMRVLLVTPGFTDTVEVVQAITNHPDKKVSSHLIIGAVTVCLNPENVFMCDHFCLPKLLDQCSQGWVNQIVFTSSSKRALTDHVQHLVKAVNTDVAVLHAENGEITRSPDIDLIMSEGAFNDGSSLRARYLSCPGWWNGQYKPGKAKPAMTEITLNFTQPLDKTRFFSKLRLLRKAHVKHPFTGNIFFIRGVVRFTGYDHSEEVRYAVLPESLSVNPAERRPVPPSAANGLETSGLHSCMVFTGCGLQQNKLMDWLRGCAPQKLEEKVRRTRASLTKTEIQRIHKKQHLQRLPEGWFYNGSQYVSLTGEKSTTHPDLEEFISDYLETVNKEVDEYNASLKRQTFHDLFEE